MKEQSDIERVRQMADKLDCITEEDFALLVNASVATVETWRKRGTAPSHILIGRRYLYPLKAVSKHLESLTRTRPEIPGKAVL